MTNAAPQRQLTLLDSICLIVGIIVGAGIYQVAPDVAKGTQSGLGLMALWLVGGVLSVSALLRKRERSVLVWFAALVFALGFGVIAISLL